MKLVRLIELINELESYVNKSDRAELLYEMVKDRNISKDEFKELLCTFRS